MVLCVQCTLFYAGDLCADRTHLLPLAFDYAVEYVHDRKQFGVPVGTFQLMQGA